MTKTKENKYEQYKGEQKLNIEDFTELYIQMKKIDSMSDVFYNMIEKTPALEGELNVNVDLSNVILNLMGFPKEQDGGVSGASYDLSDFKSTEEYYSSYGFCRDYYSGLLYGRKLLYGCEMEESDVVSKSPEKLYNELIKCLSLI